jgi:hypothetical protein
VQLHKQREQTISRPASSIAQTKTHMTNRVLTLRQLRDVIHDIYASKSKFDQKCEEHHQPRETMEQFMYTYLNQKYGLKSIIIEWAAAIIKAVNIFQKEDHEVALFGKILRCECDEEFRFIQQTVKETVIALLKAIFREKYPLRAETLLNRQVEQVILNEIEPWQWKKIIEKMYDENDQRQIEEALTTKRLKFHVFMKRILDF